MSERRTLMEPAIGQIVHFHASEQTLELYEEHKDKVTHDLVSPDHELGQTLPLIVTGLGKDDDGRAVISGMVIYNGASRSVFVPRAYEGKLPSQWQWPASSKEAN